MAQFTRWDLIFSNRFKNSSTKNLPPISLYGLHKYVFSGLFPQYTPVPRPEFSGELAPDRREAFLDALFRGTELSPLAVAPPDKASGTRNNILSRFFYHNSTESLSSLVKSARNLPTALLDQVAENVRVLIPDGHPCREWLPALTRDLLLYLVPDREAAIRNSTAEKRLALLAVASVFLGPDLQSEGAFPLERHIDNWLTAEISSAPPVRAPGLYAGCRIDRALLPELRLEGFPFEDTKAAGPSPLFRFISSNTCPTRILLHGRGETAVSGAGKTTSLQYLMEEAKTLRVLYLPLAQVYSPRAIRSPKPLEEYFRHTLHTAPEFAPGSAILLLDGLDEVCRAGLPILCEDLDWLAEKDVRIILSSRKPLEELPAFDSHLSQWTSLWRKFTPCVIQPMTAIQRGSAGSLSSQMNTPFLLSLLRQTRDLPAPITGDMVARWGGERLFSGQPQNPAEVFYAFLTAHTVRNFEICTGRERQAEADAFLLFRTLPAIAFRQLMEDIHDGNFHPAVRDSAPLDRESFGQMMKLSLAACRKGLHLLPGYRGDSLSQSLLKGLADDLTFETYAAGSVPGLFSCIQTEQDDPFDPWHEEFRFLSQSHRDFFAALHVANIFLLARGDAIPDRHELVPFLGCTLEYLPHTFLQLAADFVELMLPEGEKLEDILHGEPPAPTGVFSHMLTIQIGWRFCAYAEEADDHRDSTRRWLDIIPHTFYTTVNRAFPAAPSLLTALHSHYFLSFAESLGATSRRHRQAGNLRGAIDFARVMTHLQQTGSVPLSDGQHLHALACWSMLAANYNADEACAPYVSRHFTFDGRETALFPWLDAPPMDAAQLISAAEDVLTSLESLAAGGNGAPVFPDAGPETAQLAPAFARILRAALTACETAPAGLAQVRILSLKAKVCSIYSACAPGASGMALNLLASFLERDMEVFEHDPRLPLFQKYPDLYRDGSHFTYGEGRFVDAYRTYRRIADIRRGRQPWSARGAAALLMRDQVRLNEEGLPIPGECDPARVYTEQERSLLDRLTLQSLSGSPAIIYEYWRIRFLHDIGRKEEAADLLEQVWQKHRCFARLAGEEPIDLLTAQLTAEALGLGLYRAYDWASFLTNLSAFFCEEDTLRFTTGSHRLPCAMEDAARRIRCMGDRFNANLVRGYFRPGDF